MNTINITRSPNFFNRKAIVLIGFSIIALLMTSVANAQIDGFTEPFRSIELSSDETGSIAMLAVKEGDKVAKDEVIAKLDGRVQKLQLEIATQLAQTKSQMIAAEQSLKKRHAILNRLQELKSRGHASPSELIRAEMELSIAEAKVLSAKEEQAVRAIEQRRAEVQYKRRTILSPFDGVVSHVHRREGEFLSPLHPEVVTIIQVDRLLATFAVPSSQISTFKVGKEFNLEMDSGRTVTARVHSIGVQTDAQSGTIELKLVIDNPMMELRSGEICTLNI